jgi:translocation protein SEC62
MSGQTRSKKGQKDQPADNNLTKEETQIAKFLRFNCPKKQGSLEGMKVDFFIGSKLVDCLLESKWGPNSAIAAKSGKPSKEALLGSRASCVALMQRLLNKQLYYRAVKIYKDEEQAAALTGSTSADASDKTPNLRKRKKEKEAAAARNETTTPVTATPVADAQKEAKRKFKLVLHQDQKFTDSSEPYVWIYDPVSTKTYIIGGLLILGAIGICLFPLWPSQVREGVYYLSLAGASFLGAILAVAAFKYVLYGVVWAVTMGKVSFWLFPNLTEDVGFVESFIPVYKCSCSSQKAVESVASPAQAPATMSASSVFESDSSAPPLMTSSLTSSIITRKMSTTMTELSKSTIEISTSSQRSSDSPKPRKGSIRDEEEFELVDNEDLSK